jgi:flavin-dependent dehydrogenase
MKTVKIIGGGIAGLTAAINLKLAGIDVEVYEHKDFCGKATCDFQFLENWTFKDDALTILRSFNIQTHFLSKPWHSIELISPSLKRCVKGSSQPFMYLVKRGHSDDSIDHCLQKQALAAGIPIIFESTLKVDDAHIVATGKKDPNFIANGIMFALDHPDRNIILFDDRLAQKMYAYFIVSDNVGQIATINPTERKDHLARFNNTVEKFEEILNFKVGTVSHRFAAPGSLHVPKSAQINGRYLIGEAAGFQDCLAGFGMMYAFKSGYHAAQSIIKKDNYDRRWQKDMLKPMQASKKNRLLFEHLSNNGYEKLVDVLNSKNPLILKLLGGDDLKLILNRLYNRSLSIFFRPVIFYKKLIPIYKILFSSVARLFSSKFIRKISF